MLDGGQEDTLWIIWLSSNVWEFFFRKALSYILNPYIVEGLLGEIICLMFGFERWTRIEQSLSNINL